MEVIGFDHIYVTVADFPRSEAFYDRVMRALGFRKGDKPIAGDSHAHYFNRSLQYTIRPATDVTTRHDPYAVGLHHACFQVRERSSVDEAYRLLRGFGIEATEPAEYPEYNDDYYATFFVDPDGIRLEVVARSRHREAIVAHWHRFRVFLNPLADLQARGETSEGTFRSAPYDGGCLCGLIRYRVTAEPLTLYACHCTDCQRRTGSAFALSMVILKNALELLQGEPRAYVVTTGGIPRHGKFCGECSARLWGEPPKFPQIAVV